MFDLDANRVLLEKCLSRFQIHWRTYQRMYFYYLGITDIARPPHFTSEGAFDEGIFSDGFMDPEGAGNYSYVNDRHNHKVNTNFIKKFIKEEVSYSVGNDITYTSRTSNPDIINRIEYEMAHWPEDHESNLAKSMLTHGVTYELYYIDKQAQFCSKVISPRHGYVYKDGIGNVVYFLHIFRIQFDPVIYVDIYTQNEIIHCNEVFTEIAPRQAHPFGAVPVGIAEQSEEGWLDTIFRDIKTLQDAYETNLSDISQEITEFRNAYLAFKNAQIDEDDLPEMRKNGIIQFKGDGSAEWLVKEINDTFVQNTLGTLEDKMYKMTAHINTNESLQSNTSSLALRARLISLEEKCKLNEKALANCIKMRLQMLFSFINNLKNTKYDYKDIKIKFTPNIPSDDLANANVVSLLGDRLSRETALSLFSFVDNPVQEIKKADEENKANIEGELLLNGGGVLDKQKVQKKG